MNERQPPKPLNDLEARISQAKQAEQTRYGKSGSSGTGSHHGSNKGSESQQPGIGQALRIGLEMVSAVAVGALIGWALDQWLDTKPWLLLVFIFLGTAAGMLNVYRFASGFGYAAGYQKSEQDTEQNQEQDQDKGKD